MHACDLLVSAGRPPWRRCVAIRDGRIVAAGADLAFSAREVVDVPDGVLLPGLVDFHAHPAVSGSVFGVNPDERLLPWGTTSVLSQGDVGADGLEDFLAFTVRASATDVRLAINISRFGESRSGGAVQSLDDADVHACVNAIGRAQNIVWGISVNCSHQSCPTADPRMVLRRAIQAGGQTGRPLLVGLRRPEDWPLGEQLALLRAGDVVTYCYRRTPHCLIENGRIRPEFREARERGILFDVGHGRASFSFPVAEAAIADGFPPDTISTDYQRGHLGEQPPHTLLRTVSKLMAAGLAEEAALQCVTVTPGRMLGLPQELRPGAPASLVIARRSPKEQLCDVDGIVRIGDRLEADAVICKGHLVHSSKR